MGAFTGKTGPQSSSSTRDEKSVQSDINKALKASGGKWTSDLNKLVAERDRARAGQANPASSNGIASIGNALKSAGSNIARDIKMGVSPSSRDADYYARTAKTLARTQGVDRANMYLKQMGQDPIAAEGFKGLSQDDLRSEASRGERMGMRQDLRRNNDGSPATAPAPVANTVASADEMADQYAENMRRYQEFMQSQQPQGPAVTPEMRREALSMFESQQGAGQVPYYMAAARNQYNPNMSPAFQYAAQNYDVLGGSQRLAPRPMEMMSVAERGQISDMAQAMADEQARKQAEEAEYRRGMDMVLRGGGKGGPRTGPQIPPRGVRPRTFAPFAGGIGAFMGNRMRF